MEIKRAITALHIGIRLYVYIILKNDRSLITGVATAFLCRKGGTWLWL